VVKGVVRAYAILSSQLLKRPIATTSAVRKTRPRALVVQIRDRVILGESVGDHFGMRCERVAVVASATLSTVDLFHLCDAVDHEVVQQIADSPRGDRVGFGEPRRVLVPCVKASIFAGSSP